MTTGNTTIATDIGELTKTELEAEYGKLAECYKELRDAADAKNQEIYDLKRSLRTALQTQEYLSQELETVTTTTDLTATKQIQQLQHEIEILRSKSCDDDVDLDSKCRELVALKSIISDQEKLMKSMQEKVTDLMAKEATASAKDAMEEQFQELEKEYLSIKQAFNLQTEVLDQKQGEIDQLNDRIECSTINYQQKIDEIEDLKEKQELLQHQVIELTCELNTYKNDPNSINKKGNSLFAEVDDQRQKMIDILSKQKKHYVEMKKSYSNLENENRALKNFYDVLNKELEKCSILFKNAEEDFKANLNAQIKMILDEKHRLEAKLLLTEEIVQELKKGSKDYNWMEPMLNFSKKENVELRAELQNVRLQKAITDDQLYTVQRNFTKWKFEALKSRAVITSFEECMRNGTYKQPSKVPDIDEYSEVYIEAQPNVDHILPDLGLPRASTPELKIPDCCPNILFEIKSVAPSSLEKPSDELQTREHDSKIVDIDSKDHQNVRNNKPMCYMPEYRPMKTNDETIKSRRSTVLKTILTGQDTVQGNKIIEQNRNVEPEGSGNTVRFNDIPKVKNELMNETTHTDQENKKPRRINVKPILIRTKKRPQPIV